MILRPWKVDVFVYKYVPEFFSILYFLFLVNGEKC